MVIYSGFSHWKWWFSIAMLVYQRVTHNHFNIQSHGDGWGFSQMNIAMQGDRLIFWGHWQPLKLSAANPKMFAAWYSEIAHCLNAVWDSGKFGMSHDRVIYTYIYIYYIYIFISYLDEFMMTLLTVTSLEWWLVWEILPNGIFTSVIVWSAFLWFRQIISLIIPSWGWIQT